MGFKRGRASPCCYTHRSRDLRCIVHGDDFVFAGTEKDLEWVCGHMGKSFLVKVIGRLGGDDDDLQELRVLNRVLSWRPDGIQLEADPRHQEILASEAEENSRAVSTPGIKETSKPSDEQPP